jgi:hypothetical protein
MGVTQIKEWFNLFKDGRMTAESDQHMLECTNRDPEFLKAAITGDES